MKKRIMLTLVLLCANTATIAENYDPNAICFMANFVMQKKSDVENNKKWMAKAEPFMNLFLKQGKTREDFYNEGVKIQPMIFEAEIGELQELQKKCEEWLQKQKGQVAVEKKVKTFGAEWEWFKPGYMRNKNTGEIKSKYGDSE